MIEPVKALKKPIIEAFLRPIFFAKNAAGIVPLAVPATITPRGKVTKLGSGAIRPDKIPPIKTMIGAVVETNGCDKNNRVILFGKSVNLRIDNATAIKTNMINNKGYTC